MLIMEGRCSMYVAALLLSLAGGCGSPYLLTVEDRVGRTGQDIQLVAKLEYKGIAVFNRGIEDREVSFYLDGHPLEAAETGDEGYAHVERDFDAPGTHRLVAAFEKDGDRKAEATATVFIWNEKDRILVVDMDDTIVDTKKRFLYPFSSPDLSPPVEGSADVLRDLSRKFRIVYLTARPREMFPKTRQWLQRNAFPPGPLKTWDEDQDPWSRTDYKKDRIDELQDDFDCVTIGFGNSETDYDAYRSRQLFCIILDREAPPKKIRSGVQLPSWSAIRELFVRNPQLHHPELADDMAVTMPPWSHQPSTHRKQQGQPPDVAPERPSAKSGAAPPGGSDSPARRGTHASRRGPARSSDDRIAESTDGRIVLVADGDKFTIAIDDVAAAVHSPYRAVKLAALLDAPESLERLHAAFAHEMDASGLDAHYAMDTDPGMLTAAIHLPRDTSAITLSLLDESGGPRASVPITSVEGARLAAALRGYLIRGGLAVEARN